MRISSAESPRREKDVEALTKDRDGLIKAKKEIKLTYEKMGTYLTDYAKVCGAVSRVKYAHTF